MEIQKKIELLKNYFSKQSDVSMAFIFGSYAKKRETSESDFDVAIYFKPRGKMLEWEEIEDRADEDKIWSDIERIIGIRTDLVVLNRAPATLAFSVIQEGTPIIIKDSSLHLRFFLAISSAAEYFTDFTKDFWAIKQRSSSLTEIDQQRLIRIIDFLETELADSPKFLDLDQKIYESDAVVRRNVERWAENIVNSSIDIAKIILASEKKKIPQTYREIMHELSLLKDFKNEDAERLAQSAKLRNILAHEYLDVRFRQIEKFTKGSLPAYRALLDFAKKFI